MISLWTTAEAITGNRTTSRATTASFSSSRICSLAGFARFWASFDTLPRRWSRIHFGPSRSHGTKGLRGCEIAAGTRDSASANVIWKTASGDSPIANPTMKKGRSVFRASSGYCESISARGPLSDIAFADREARPVSGPVAVHDIAGTPSALSPGASSQAPWLTCRSSRRFRCGIWCCAA